MQAIVLDEVLRSLMKFASSVTAALLPMPAAVNYTVPDSRQCKDVPVVQKILGRKSLLVHEILSKRRASKHHKYYCDTTSTNPQG
ncbi:MAG: hypothetical protein V7K18_03895 [Nostoc sp.]|uniref:hypothetical protein n=1 Tax=Nostoc sp. TaxID=1180 RepID=UPI002FF8AB30